MKAGRKDLVAAMAVLSCLALNCADDKATRPDTRSPAAISDLVAQTVTSSSLLLIWTATGDDGREGRAAEYDVRHSFIPEMTAEGGFWDKATRIPKSPTPRLPGERECLLVTELDPDTLYYFGVRVADEASNWSTVSNVVSYRTVQQEPVFGVYDAEFVAMKLSQEVLAPRDLVEQIARHLAIIRSTYPYMRTVGVFPDWHPGQLFVRLTDDAWEEFKQGEYRGLDELNAQYGPVTITKVVESNQVIQLAFDQAYNPELLARIYAGAEGVYWAQPVLVWGDGSNIWCGQLGTYTFDMAWGNCSLTCLFHHYWVFEVDECKAELLDEYGHPLPTNVVLSDVTAF